MNKYFIPIIILASLVSVIFLWQSTRAQVDKVTQTEKTKESKVPCGKSSLPENIEGPYYKEGSPQRTTISDENTQGTPLALTGTVMDENCNPIANAWIDFWQTDGNGNYDNEGYRLRGHQYTDTSGKYMLNTVIPGDYPGRTPHIHVKMKVQENSQIITTQLYIPNVPKNNSDTLFNEATLIDIKDSTIGVRATYDFIINTN